LHSNDFRSYEIDSREDVSILVLMDLAFEFVSDLAMDEAGLVSILALMDLAFEYMGLVQPEQRQ